jgi:TonB family protein
LFVWSRRSAFAQQTPQANEKERGIELYRKGNFSEAVKALKDAVKNQQKDSDAWYYLGLSLLRAGKTGDARKAFEKTVLLKPDFAPAYKAMAYLQLLGNDNKGAVKNAEKALALDPKDYESLYIAGMGRLRENAAAEALARAEEALKIKPDYAMALLLKTEALMGMFAQGRDTGIGSLDQGERNKLSSEAESKLKRLPSYSLLKAASESLEAYLKLSPEPSEQAYWNERLEALRFYTRWAEGSEKSVVQMTSTLKPTILYRERARYPEEARAAGVQGTVVLKVVFDVDGTVKHILVVKGLSHGLTEEAIVAARKIRFTPAMGVGEPISVIGNLEFTFSM